MCKRCTEIGVDAFVPVKCTRSVSKWQEKDTEHKLERLRRTVLSACKQCGGSVPASVSGPVSVREAAEAEHEFFNSGFRGLFAFAAVDDDDLV